MANDAKKVEEEIPPEAATEESSKPSACTSKRPAEISGNDDDGEDDHESASKRARSGDDESATAAPLDLAVTLGYKPGDRLEVQWEIEMNDKVEMRWWGCTLEPHDGRTEDSVAIRVLHYDAYPEAGFEECRDDVIFMGHDLLVTPDSQTQLKFRREGDEAVVWYNEGDLDEQLNSILMGALNNHKTAWNTLTAAQQASIADKIATKKERLMEVLKGHKAVITSATIKDILQQAFG